MAKQLIVVVHGVGIRAAGESADLVAAALDPNVAADPVLPAPNLSGAASSLAGAPGLQDPGPGAAGWRRRASDDFRILEPDAFGTAGLYPDFPARISRFRRYKGDQPAKTSDERVIADFYWGDVGGLVRSPPAIVLGLVRVMLGLVHVVRENALCVFPGADRAAAQWRRLARGAALAIHGPVFALHIVLFFGMIGVATFGPAGPRPIAVATVLSLVTAGLLQWRSRTFLLRHLGAYTGLFGLLVAALFGMDQWATTAALLNTLIDPLAQRGLCSWMNVAEGSRCAEQHATGAYVQSLRLQVILVALWLGISAATIGFAGHAYLAGRNNPEAARRNLLAPTLSLMSLLWFLVFGLGWALVDWSLDQIGAPVEIVATSQRGLLAVIAALGGLAIVAVVVVGRRWWRLRRMAPADFLAQAPTESEATRLIVALPIRHALLVMPVALIAIILTSVGSAPDVCHPDPAATICYGHVWTTKLVAYGALAVTLLGSVLLWALPRVLAVGGDVIMYINDIRWRYHPDDPGTTLTWAERRLGLPVRPMAPGLDGYLFRQRIRGRMQRLMADLIRTEEPSRIDIVAHSQGTVIAIDVLRRHGRGWSAGGRSIGLTTMGSPYGHLFMTHFDPAFQDPESGVAPGSPVAGEAGQGSLQAAVATWTNIFRIDDPIGTTVGSGTWHEEIALPPGGHSNYWRDARVSRILQARLAFPAAP